MTTKYTVFQGCLVDTPSVDQLRIRPNSSLGVDHVTGRIIGTSDSAKSAVGLVSEWTGQTVAAADVTVSKLSAGQFLMPGFIDTHTHAPQFTFQGLGNDLPLMDWLEKYTFKHESAFKDVQKAQKFYADAIGRVVRNGVTFAAYYGTIHLEANKVLADVIRQVGQRAYVGKVCMDTNAPDFYRETTEESIKHTEEFIQTILEQEQQEPRLVTPIITPRFVPTCTGGCLQGLGQLADKYQVPIQSHLDENPSEIQFSESLFPDSPSYTHIYHKYGLLNSRTIMAHCVHMKDSEIQLMREAGAGVSHCPNSNFTMTSGIADVRRFLSEGIPVGLGTDVSGGYVPSIQDAMRMAAAANRALLAFKRDRGDQLAGRDAVPLEAGEALYLATQGGAQVMGMARDLGSLDSGKLFDALVVDLDVKSSPVPDVGITPSVEAQADPKEAWKLRLEQFVFLSDDRNISQVFVGGKQIHAL